DHKQYGEDPGADGSTNGGAQGYAAHYCNYDSPVDPTLVACSFIASGLRLFDISDVAHPREVGYFVAPTDGDDGSNFAMSQPAFVAKRREILWAGGCSARTSRPRAARASAARRSPWPGARCPAGSAAASSPRASTCGRCVG